MLSPKRLFGCVLALVSCAHLRASDLRIEHSAGVGEEAIAAAIKQVVRDGGGVVTLGRGEYTIGKPLQISAAKKLTLRGEPGTVLKFVPMVYGEIAVTAKPGESRIQIQKGQGFQAGLELRIMAPGVVHPFTGKPTPHFAARVQSVTENFIVLQKPLEYSAPAGTQVLWGDEPNMIEISGAAEDIAIEQLTLDGGAYPNTPQVSTHNTRCGVWVTGRYDYAKGPLGPKPRNVQVRDCHLRHFHGRGLAFYSVEDCVVERCRIEHTLDEAIDFDHFAVRGVARENEIVNCRVGIELNDANDCAVERNSFVGGSAGVRIWRWCKMPELNVRNRVAHNKFQLGKRPAIEFLEGTSQNAAEGNVISAPAGTKAIEVIRNRGEANVIGENTMLTE